MMQGRSNLAAVYSWFQILQHKSYMVVSSNCSDKDAGLNQKLSFNLQDVGIFISGENNKIMHI